MDKNDLTETQKGNEVIYDRVISSAFRLGFIAILLIASYLILMPFLIMILWAIIIAIGIYPVFKKLSAALGGRRKLASFILTIILLSVLIVPSILLLDSTISGIKGIKAEYDAGTLVIPPPSEDVAEWPVIGKSVYETWKDASKDLRGTILKYQPHVTEYALKALDVIKGIGSTILLSIISIIIAGVFLLKAEKAEKSSHRVFTYLIGNAGDEFTNVAVSTIRSVVQGVLGIAFLQGVAAGILMLLFHIPAAGLWALLVLMLAIVQFPPIIVMLPVSIYAFNVMDTTSAVIFLILGIIISQADMFLKPIFLGRGVDVPMLVILLGAIGGVIVFGIMGLFVGAVLLALAYKIYQLLLNKEVQSPKVETSSI